MTAAFPDPDRDGDPEDPDATPLGDDEISRRFDDIVSGMSADMDWDTSGPVKQADRDTTPAPGTSAEWYGTATPERTDRSETAERRRLRREHRKENRAAEVTEMAAEQARREAEYASDDEGHFVPGEPPPVGRPKLRTVTAILLLAAGMFLLLGPNVLNVSPNGVLLLAGVTIVAGGALLVSGLRRTHGDVGDGWDDGSRV